MIKIVKGKFGFWDGYKVVPKTCNDEPFSIDTKREAELVGDGIAEYVGNETTCEDETDVIEEACDEEEYEVTTEKLEEMSLNQLEAFAEQFNIKRKNSKKADFINEILDALDKEVESESENELKIDPLEAVQ